MDEDQALSELQEELHVVGVDHAAEEDHEVLNRGAVAVVVCGILADTIHDELSDVVHTGSGASTALEAGSAQEVLLDKDSSHGLDEATGRPSWDEADVV